MATSARGRGRAGSRALDADHERFLSSGSVPGRVRRVVAESWRRSMRAGVVVDRSAPPMAMDASELAAYRQGHPLADVFPLLYDVLGRAAEASDCVMAVGDAAGRLMWVCGPRRVVARAEQIAFAEGRMWDEAHAGTNAPGTALHLDRPVQILAEEHFSQPVRSWSCAAAPIHHPLTHDLLGVVDVTGGESVASPMVMSAVRAAARLAETELHRIELLRDGGRPAGTVADGTPTVAALGRPDCLVSIDGRMLRLSRRHSEIFVLLVENPAGVSGEQLLVELYAGDMSESTIRAEMTRLRGLLGPVLRSRPYRLETGLRCDWLEAARLVEAGRPAEALSAYRGPLLPSSDAPGVRRRRDRLHRQLQRAVLGSSDLDLMGAWTRTADGADDLAVWRRQAELVPAWSPLRSLIVAEVARLDREYGATGSTAWPP